MTTLSDKKTKALYDRKGPDGRSWLYNIPNTKRGAWMDFVSRTVHDYEKIKNRGMATEDEYNDYVTAVNEWRATY